MHSKVNENVNGKYVVETQTDYLKSHKKCYICEQAIQLINTRDDTWREEPVGLIRLNSYNISPKQTIMMRISRN